MNKELIEYVVFQLTGMDQEEMTVAETNIANKLVKLGYCDWEENEFDEKFLVPKN